MIRRTTVELTMVSGKGQMDSHDVYEFFLHIVHVVLHLLTAMYKRQA